MGSKGVAVGPAVMFASGFAVTMGTFVGSGLFASLSFLQPKEAAAIITAAASAVIFNKVFFNSITSVGSIKLYYTSFRRELQSRVFTRRGNVTIRQGEKVFLLQHGVDEMAPP